MQFFKIALRSTISNRQVKRQRLQFDSNGEYLLDLLKCQHRNSRAGKWVVPAQGSGLAANVIRFTFS
jgi:hypothetical protein